MRDPEGEIFLAGLLRTHYPMLPVDSRIAGRPRDSSGRQNSRASAIFGSTGTHRTCTSRITLASGLQHLWRRVSTPADRCSATDPCFRTRRNDFQHIHALRRLVRMAKEGDGFHPATRDTLKRRPRPASTSRIAARMNRNVLSRTSRASRPNLVAGFVSGPA